jgi:hypothetical protein
MVDSPLLLHYRRGHGEKKSRVSFLVRSDLITGINARAPGRAATLWKDRSRKNQHNWCRVRDLNSRPTVYKTVENPAAGGKQRQ